MEDIWERLRQKLDGMTKGYPKTDAGVEFHFLKKIFTEEDAEFFIQFKPGLQSVAEVAEHYGMTFEDAESRLEDMCRKHLMYWERYDSLQKKYRIIPFIHGLWEFNLEHFNRDDAKNMAIFYANGFAEAFMDYRLPLARVLPINADVVKDHKLLPADDYVAVIKKQSLIVASDCACRKVASFSKRHCDCTDNLNVCYFFGDFASYVLEENIGHPRTVDTNELLTRIEESNKVGYFLQASHTREIQSICNCSKCHCGVLAAAKISQGSSLKNWSNYRCIIDDTECTSCGICVERCPLNALHMDEDGKTRLNASRCIGCGLCVTACPTKAVILERKPDDELTFGQDETPYDAMQRMGLEKAIVDKERLAAIGQE